MALRFTGKSFALLIAVAGLCQFAWAGDDGAAIRRNFSKLINVDALVDNYLRVLAKKYDLDEAQTDFTNQLVKARVDEFLDRHYDELGGIVDRLFDVRRGGEMSQAELMEWGMQTMPIYEEARSLITEANEEWRGILNEKQRKIHDEDLRLMNESFATTEDQLSRIVAGEMTVDEFRNPRRSQRRSANRAATRDGSTQFQASSPNVETGEQGVQKPPATVNRVRPVAVPPRPTSGNHGASSATHANPNANAAAALQRPTGQSNKRPPRNTRAGNPAAAKADTFESKWEQYVKQFCDKYSLNEDQRAAADKILKSCQEQAGRYATRAERLGDRLDKQMEALRKSEDPDKLKQVADLAEKKKKLTEPIDQIFETQLKPRLERLPTRAQRDAAENPKPKTPEPKK